MTKVAIFMGSLSDEPNVRPCADVLESLGVAYTFTVTSAHRTPERTEKLVGELEKDGCEVFICAAGMAAHLAGAVAARTIKPVIGIPVTASSLNGMDALLATVALDKAGARNAAWMAAQILALRDEALAEKIRQARRKFKDDVEKAAASLQ